DGHVTGVQTCALPIWRRSWIIGIDVAGEALGGPPPILFVRDTRWRARRLLLVRRASIVGARRKGGRLAETIHHDDALDFAALERSEERRVGKGGASLR